MTTDQIYLNLRDEIVRFQNQDENLSLSIEMRDQLLGMIQEKDYEYLRHRLPHGCEFDTRNFRLLSFGDIVIPLKVYHARGLVYYSLLIFVLSAEGVLYSELFER